MGAGTTKGVPPASCTFERAPVAAPEASGFASSANAVAAAPSAMCAQKNAMRMRESQVLRVFVSVFNISPLLWPQNRMRSEYAAHAGRKSNRAYAAFAGANANHFVERADENLSVADYAGAGAFDDGFDHRIDQFLGDHNAEKNLRQKIHVVLGAAVSFSVALLAAETADFGNGEAGDAERGDALLHRFELRRPDHCINALHIGSLL